ncbi:MAG: FkbM family methyltransferase, partial [Helicobacter sp.]|nr:FkbM family methyltransferase [Helicobacter sp.]
NNFGLGRTNEERILYYNQKGSGLASLTKRDLEFRNIPFEESEKVQIFTLDTYCKQKSIEHISLLKIDVEGHELDVFAGAKEMFAKRAIDIVTFEFGGCNIDTRTFFKDFWFFFERENMALYRFLPNKKLLRLDCKNIPLLAPTSNIQ